MRSFEGSRRDDLGTALRAAAVPWILARVAVLGALGLVRTLTPYLDPGKAAAVARVREGLFGWDGDWYARIALDGYGSVPEEGLRFFPLYPLLARVLGPLTGGAKPALLLIANGGALLFGVLLYRLALRETGDERLARRAAWLVALAPPSFVLVMAYSEALAGVLAVAVFLGARRQRWWWAAAAGLAAGLIRPSGLFITVAVAIEVGRGIRAAPRRELVARAAALLAPAAGAAVFLLWVRDEYGDALLPFRVQQRDNLRGDFASPFATIADTWHLLWTGSPIRGFHLLWLAVLVFLAVVTARRWPASYSAFALVTLVSAVSTSNLNSLERYGLGAFPFVLAAATVTRGGRMERSVLVVSSVAMAGYAILAFFNAYVP